LRFLLDTNVVVAILKKDRNVLDAMRRWRPCDIGMPAIVSFELLYGIEKSRRAAENLANFQALRFEVVAFDETDARHAGDIRASLERRGTPIGAYDILIAGQARARGLTLVTRNTAEFARVEGLSLDNWQD
jgi:tRNA(fMet)-specific endonuclease VapC